MTLLRAEVQCLVGAQLKEMVASQVAMMEAVQGLLERFGSCLERAEIALARFSLGSVVVPLTPAPPPPVGISIGCSDGGSQLFGPFSPRDATISATRVALEHAFAVVETTQNLQESVMPGALEEPGSGDLSSEVKAMECEPNMPNLPERVGFDTPRHEEYITVELVQIDDEGPLERASPGSVGGLFQERPALLTDHDGDDQQVGRDIVAPVHVSSGQ